MKSILIILLSAVIFAYGCSNPKITIGNEIQKNHFIERKDIPFNSSLGFFIHKDYLNNLLKKLENTKMEIISDNDVTINIESILMKLQKDSILLTIKTKKSFFKGEFKNFIMDIDYCDIDFKVEFTAMLKIEVKDKYIYANLIPIDIADPQLIKQSLGCNLKSNDGIKKIIIEKIQSLQDDSKRWCKSALIDFEKKIPIEPILIKNDDNSLLNVLLPEFYFNSNIEIKDISILDEGLYIGIVMQPK